MEELERRVEDLEVRLTFQQDVIRQLDEVIQSQGARIDLLMRELKELREQVKNDPGDEAPPEEQVPPHW